jgi:hypothetical protein
MNDQPNDGFDDKSPPPRTLNDKDITTTKLKGRRLFMGTLGITALVATTIAIGHNPSSVRAETHHDFPKGSSDSDATQNKDLKAVDSDDRNSKSVDSDQNRLRDAKRSADSD